VLLVDDEKAWLHSMSLTLERKAGVTNLRLCSDGSEALEILRGEDIALLILDLTMPPPTGEEILAILQEESPHVPVIVMTGMNDVESAVYCMKHGAFDYFVKTDDSNRIIAGVQRALRMRELELENRKLRSGMLEPALRHPEVFTEMDTVNPQVKTLFQYVEAVAPSTQPILVTGESGTGKELITRAIHRLSRPAGALVAVNAAGLDDAVFADTLFGHVRGAFTGAEKDRPGMIEQADGGTLFLDEIGDLPAASQVKILRLLQENEYLPLGADRPRKCNARIVVATNADLEQQVKSGAFRKDLYFRLNTHQITLPPLRERLEDIPLLADRFLAEAAEKLDKKKPTPPEELYPLLKTYSFPGNIRELRSLIFDAVSLHQTGKLSLKSFRKTIGGSELRDLSTPLRENTGEITYPAALPTLEEAGAMLVNEALKRSEGNQTIAAGLLGISRPALYKRLKKMKS